MLPSIARHGLAALAFAVAVGMMASACEDAEGDEGPDPGCLQPAASCTSNGTPCCGGNCGVNGRCPPTECIPLGGQCGVDNTWCCEGYCWEEKCGGPCYGEGGVDGEACEVKADCCGSRVRAGG